LLKHYESPTIAALVGFMIGSLRLIVHRAQYAMVEENGIEIEQALTISSETLIFAVLLAIAGFVLVTVIDHAQSRSNPLLRLVWR
jgi:uncharacterized membrane protein